MGIVSTTISRLEPCRQKTEGVDFRVLWDMTSDQTRWRWKFTVPKCDIVVYMRKWFPKYLGFSRSWDRLLSLDLCFQDLRIFPISQYEDLKLSERKLVMICTHRIKWRDVLPCTHTKRLLWFPNRVHPQNIPPCFILRCNWVQITVSIPNSLEFHGKCCLIMNVSSDYKLTVILRGHSSFVFSDFVVKCCWCWIKYECRWGQFMSSNVTTPQSLTMMSNITGG